MRHLDAIEKAAMKVEGFTGRPDVFSSSVVAGLVAMMFGLIAQCATNDIRITVAVASVAFLVIFFVYYYFGPVSCSGAEVLDELLADYEPVDEHSYAQLQASARKTLVLDTLEVGRWLQRERSAIKNHIPLPHMPASRFMNKVLGYS